MKFPLISIGITTYNAICTVQQAIESALAQTWQNLEIIIVDDCSTDGTYEYLKKSILILSMFIYSEMFPIQVSLIVVISSLTKQMESF